MKIDIIIPVYNYSIYLKDALNSCMLQTYQNFEIFVIDDGSSENIKDIASKYPKVNYIRLDKNSGPGIARNIGVKYGNGTLISFLDADDIWCEKKLELSYNEFISNPSIDMTCGNYRRLISREKNKIKILNPFYRYPLNITWELLMKNNYVASGSVTIRRNIFEKVGGFDERFRIAEDYSLWLRVAENNKIKYIHEVLYLYSVAKNSNSLTHRAEIQNEHLKILDIIKKESTERKNLETRDNLN